MSDFVDQKDFTDHKDFMDWFIKVLQDEHPVHSLSAGNSRAFCMIGDCRQKATAITGAADHPHPTFITACDRHIDEMVQAVNDPDSPLRSGNA